MDHVTIFLNRLGNALNQLPDETLKGVATDCMVSLSTLKDEIRSIRDMSWVDELDQRLADTFEPELERYIKEVLKDCEPSYKSNVLSWVLGTIEALEPSDVNDALANADIDHILCVDRDYHTSLTSSDERST